MLALLPSCQTSYSPVTGKKRAYGYSWEQELQIGREADASIIAQYGLYDDPSLTAYVDEIGQRLVNESHMRRPDARPEFQNTEFVFRVLDSPVINAFALPGGYIYVTRGLMAHLENEAQLAVVLGHEIGHVAARHASQRALNQQLGQLGLVGGAVLGEVFFGAGQQVLEIGGPAAQLLFLKYGRNDELESDKLGVEYAALEGYEACEGAQFFTTLKRISDKAGQSIPSFLSTHPDPGDREGRILAMADEWEARGTRMTETDADEYLGQIDNIVVGENPRQGFVENSLFLHPDLRFQYPVPSGWTLQNSPSQVVMFEGTPQQVNAILAFTIEADASSVQDAARAFGQLEGITVNRSGDTRINGLPAVEVTASAQGQQQGQSLGIRAYFIEYGGNVYRFLGYTSSQQFRDYERDFDRAARGFRQLTDRRILNVQPDRLDIVSVNRTADFQTLLPGSLPSQFDPEDVAIMNQLQLNTQVRAGDRIKLIR